MEQAYTIIADLHTHTLASTHAYSSLTEMVRAAAERGLYAIAITDHGQDHARLPQGLVLSATSGSCPSATGVCSPWRASRPTCWTLRAAWTWSPATPGRWTGWWPPSTTCPWRGCKTRTWRSAPTCGAKWPRTPRVHVIGHSGDPQFAYDVDKVIPLFGEHHKLVEINNHSFQVRPDNIPNCTQNRPVPARGTGCPLWWTPTPISKPEVGCFDKALAMLAGDRFPPGADSQRLGTAPGRLPGPLHLHL